MFNFRIIKVVKQDYLAGTVKNYFMKYLSTLLLTIVLSISARAQTTAAAYNFSAMTGTYSSISATGTLMGSTFFGDDRNQTNVPIGFTFVFCGASYTQLSACSNGWLSLNNSSSTILTNSAANVTGAGFLMPYWDDLNGSGHTAYYQTTGTSPNRVFTFEWNNWGTFTGSGTTNMQVKLYETTNAIEFWYGTSTYASHSATIGIANSTTDYQTLPNVSASPTPSSTTFTTNLTTSPASGQIYKWFPCTVTTTAASSPAVCPGGTVTLTGTTTGTSFTWSGPGGYTSTTLSPVINGITAGGVYTLSGTDGTCTTSATTTVSLLTAPAAPVVLPASAIICNGNSLSLNATLPPSTINLIPFEGWETGMPTVPGTPVDGWMTTSTSTSYLTRSTSGSYPTASPHGGSYMADFHSFSYSGVNASLIAPSFSMTGITGGQVTFWMYRDNGYNSSSYNTEGITVYLNTSASTTGATNICFIPRRIGLAPTGTVTGTATPSSNGWYQYTVSIPAAFSGPANYVIFYFNSNWGNDIYLDDISVTGNQSIAPPTWTPATYLYNNAAFTAAYNPGDTTTGVFVHPTTVTSPTTVNYIASITNGVCTSSDTAVITINPGVPAITGTTTICVSTSVTLSDAAAGGTWSTSNNTVATVDPVTGQVHGILPGIDTVNYTVPGGCAASVVVNVTTTTTATTGNTILCNGGFTSALSNPTTGGTWTTSNAAVASVNSAGTVTSGTAGTAVITYTLPSGCTDTTLFTVAAPPPAITGSPNVCYNGGVTTLYDSAIGGTWSSSNTAVATVDAATGVVTGISGGSAAISYTTLPGCYAVLPLNPLSNPAPIAGTMAVCEAGSVTTLSDATTGGTWNASGSAVTINATSGAVTGVTAGSAIITYTAPNNCYVTALVTVNPLPAPITGTFVVCQTNTTVLNDASSGGNWTTAATGIATVDDGGNVGGIAAGIAPVTYTLPTGCRVSANVTVDQIPAPIAGNDYVCNGYTSALSDASPAGGVWTSNNASIISVDSTTGMITGHAVGNAIITYRTGPGSCRAVKNVTVSPIAPPSVSIFPSTGSTICAGTSVTFNSVVGGGGSAPVYVWSVNNVILAGGTSYSYVPADGDLVRLWVLSNYECAIPDTASASVVMTVNPIVTPAVGITTGMGDTVCEGVPVTLMPLPSGGGTSPVYQWSVNGVATSVGPSYSYVPANGDVVNVMMTSSAPCRLADVASANKILTVSPFVTPAVTFNASLGPVACEGYTDVFVASQTNGGTSPAYAWTVNGTSAGSGPVFAYTPANGDLVQVTLTSNFPCVSTPTAVQTMAMTVLPVVNPVGNVYAVPGYIVAPGMYDTFHCQIISGGGYAPQYQWMHNGVPVPGATDNVYVTNALNNGDSISCQVTNTDQCSGISTFNSIIITVGANVGVNNVTDKGDITLAPNPNTGSFTISGNMASTSTDANIEVTDMLGKILYRNKVTTPGGHINEKISLDDVANGVYILNIRTAETNRSVHFSVQR